MVRQGPVVVVEGVRRSILVRGHDDQVDAAVVGAALGSRVGVDGVELSVTGGGEVVRGNGVKLEAAGGRC